MVEARLNLTKTRDIKKPTYYVTALRSEYTEYAYDEERAELYRGEWRKKSFVAHEEHIPLDLEIGTGNGYFFSHRAEKEPQRLLVGIEIKFKPLIQTIRRALNLGLKNVRVLRYNAKLVENLFMPGEINNIFVHHPDPWTRRRAQKHRLLRREYLNKLHTLQRPQSYLEFKTDSADYFFWAVEEFKNSNYKIERYTEDLHNSEWSGENFTTHFERIFLAKGQSIYYLRALRS
jgi:tRNA (guanine-N7-)-methyltransferase